MMFHWTNDMIRFMKDASEHETYHAELTAHMRPYLRGHVCDAGCGLGYLSLEMASHVPHVTAVDVKEQALAVLHTNMEKCGISNIQPVCGDIAACPPPRPYDTMVFCMFGKPREVLSLARQQCCGSVVLIQSDEARHGFSIDNVACKSTDSVEEMLRVLSVPYFMNRFAISFGQPLRSLEDAVRFFQIYGRKEDVTQAMILDRLRRTGDSVYPYYLPRIRKMRMLVFNAADLLIGKEPQKKEA